MWFLLALFAGFLFATNRLLVRSILLKGGNPIAFVASHNMVAGLLLLPVALWESAPLPNLAACGVLLLGVVAFLLGDLFAFLSLERIEASVYQILGQVRHIIILLGGFLLFSEVISAPKIISIILLTLGVVVALVEKSRIEISRGVTFGILSPVFISFGFLTIKQVSGEVSAAFSAFAVLFLSGVLAYLILLASGKKSIRLLPVKKPSRLFLAAAIFSIFELVLFAALDIGEASRVTPVAQSSLLFTLIGGYIFLKERERLAQKICGSILIVIGIGLLFFF
jgi:drug/metabolite transporter (DMT)-like permease